MTERLRVSAHAVEAPFGERKRAETGLIVFPAAGLPAHARGLASGSPLTRPKPSAYEKGPASRRAFFALSYFRTHALTHSRTHALTHSRTHALTHPRTPLPSRPVHDHQLLPDLGAQARGQRLHLVHGGEDHGVVQGLGVQRGELAVERQHLAAVV